jgi:hypothetical protein
MRHHALNFLEDVITNEMLYLFGNISEAVRTPCRDGPRAQPRATCTSTWMEGL